MIQSKNKPLTAQQLKGIRDKKSLMLESMRGLTGAKGDKGDKGLQGEVGADGIAGINGQAGMNGEAGPRGPRGPQGEAGKNGAIGATGKPGEDGEDGRGIVRLQIHGKDLIVTYTDGDKVNLGRVVGDRGPKGDKGRSGYAFGDTTTTNITEEVLSPEDSENLETIADNSVSSLAKLTDLVINQKCQLAETIKELNYIKTHLSLMTDEELNENDTKEL